jgi:hypothetical protein
MNRTKHFEPRFHGRGSSGRRLCVWCGTEVPPDRRRWCSQECVMKMQLEHWPGAWARAVIERDKGICQACGFDGRLVKRILHHLMWDNGESYYQDPEHREAERFYRSHLSRLGFSRGQNLMQADHIIPVVDGGTNTLENGRCLCQPCHKSETARLANSRKLEKRASRIGINIDCASQEAQGETS